MAEYIIPTQEEWDRARLLGDPPAPMFVGETIKAYTERMKLRRATPTEQWKGRIARGEISGMVDKWYEMDPEVEDLLYDGAQLRDGMVVLIESPHLKVDVRDELTDEQLYQAHRWNRWLMVARVENNGESVLMLAEYEDGTKAKLEFPIHESWLCKFGRPVIGRAEVTGQMYFTDPGVQVVEERNWIHEHLNPEDMQSGGQVVEEEFRREREGTWNHDHLNPIHPPRQEDLTGGSDTTAAQIRDQIIANTVAPGSNLRPVPKSMFEETEAKWEREKGTPFPESPFSTR